VGAEINAKHETTSHSRETLLNQQTTADNNIPNFIEAKTIPNSYILPPKDKNYCSTEKLMGIIKQ
jgi:hypothetical protein